MRNTIRRFGTTRLLALGSLALCMVALLALVAPLTLAGGDGEVVSATADMDGDGEPDTTETNPDEGPGEVVISASTVGGGAGEIILRGRDPGDRFGEDVAILNDITGNGAFDLIVGAPGAGPTGQGEAYVFFGPFEIPPGETELVISANDADIKLVSFFEDDDNFGRRVAPLYDITGDGYPELRVQSLYTHTDGLDYIFTQVFYSQPTPGYANGGELAFIVINRPCHHDGFWQYLEGDAHGDQAVTFDDFMRVALNFGNPRPDLTRFDGDLNGDGVVDGADLDLVLNSLDTVGSIVNYGLQMPLVQTGETLVLHYPALEWAVITSASIPIGPGEPANAVEPIEPCDLNPDCPCGGGGMVDCGVTPCASECGGVCNPDCEGFDPCHPDCDPDEFCCDSYPCSVTCGGDGCGGICDNDPCLAACNPAPDCCTAFPCAPSCGGTGCSGDPCVVDPCAGGCGAPDCCDHHPCAYSCGGSGCGGGGDPPGPGWGSGCTLKIELCNGDPAPHLFCPDIPMCFKTYRDGDLPDGCGSGTIEWEVRHYHKVIREETGPQLTHTFDKLGLYVISAWRADECCGSAWHVIHIVEARLESTTFHTGDNSPFHHVRRDSDGASYETPHWLSLEVHACLKDPFCCDGWDPLCDEFGERSHPVAYTRKTSENGATLSVSASFDIKAPSFWWDIASWRAAVVARRPDGTILAEEASIYFSYGGSNLTLVATIDALPSVIDHIDPLTLEWSLEVDFHGFLDEWHPLPCALLESKNTLYVTLVDPPHADARYHTVLDIACRRAKGLDDTHANHPQHIIDKIWEEFVTRNITRAEPGPPLVPGGPPQTVTLHYYLDWNVGNSTAAALLADTQYQGGGPVVGDGHCMAWQELFRTTLSVHGVPVQNVHIYPNVPDPEPGQPPHEAPTILVKTWDVVGQSNTYPGYPYDNRVFGWKPFAFNHQTMTGSYVWVNGDADIVKNVVQGGLPGQGTANPLALFEGHSFNLVNGKYYDPSYGTGPFDSLGAWNNASLAAHGFGRQVGAQRYLHFKNAMNNGGELECWGCP